MNTTGVAKKIMYHCDRKGMNIHQFIRKIANVNNVVCKADLKHDKLLIHAICLLYWYLNYNNNKKNSDYLIDDNFIDTDLMNDPNLK